MARPTKKNPKGEQKKPKKTKKVIRELRSLLLIGCSITEACVTAGISTESYYRWINSDEELRNEFANAKKNIFVKARKRIFENLDDPTTARWFAERRMKEFKPKIGIEADNPLVGEKKQINILINNLNLNEKDFEKKQLANTIQKLACEIIDKGEIDSSLVIGETDSE